MSRLPFLAIMLVMLAGAVVGPLSPRSAVGASSGSVVVGATVPTVTSLDTSACSGAPTLAFTSLTAGSTSITSTPCTVQFGSNAPARLGIYQRDRDGAAMTKVRSAMDTRSGVASLRAVDAIDANDIWVAGARVNQADPTPLRHTVDGGATWNAVTACAGMAGSIWHVVAWTSSELVTINGNTVCRSVDGGGSWTSLTAPHSFRSDSPPSNPPGTDVLWAASTTNGRLLRSVDRGATWSSVTVPSAVAPYNVVGWGTLNAVAIATVTAGDGTSKTAYSYSTTDAGVTWATSTIATIPVATIPSATGTLARMARSSTSGRIVAVGAWAPSNKFAQYYSDDDGATWTARPAPPFTDRIRHVSGTTWVGANRLSAVYLSTDDGLTWGAVSMGGDGNTYANAISQSRGGAVYVVGDGASVYRSTDTGASWSSISETFPAYLAVVPFGSRRIAVVGTDGAARWSADAGATLGPATGCTGTQFRDGVAAGPLVGVVVGNAGAICRTTDAGMTWTNVSSGSATNFLGVVRVAADGRLLAYGPSGTTFVESFDDGLTWQSLDLGLTGTITKAAVNADASTIAVARGSGGLLWVSTDAGETWASRDDGIASLLRSVSVSPSGDQVFTTHQLLPVDGLNRVASSSDGGVTWTVSSPSVASEWIGAEFASEDRMWLLVGNQLWTSDDSGATFSYLTTSPGYASNLEVVDAHTALTSGTGQLLAMTKPTVEVPDVAPGTGLTTSGGGFGGCLLAVTNATPGWPMPGTCSAGNATAWRPVLADSTNASSTIATMTTGGTASVDLVFGMRVSLSQASGAYSAHVAYEVVAP